MSRQASVCFAAPPAHASLQRDKRNPNVSRIPVNTHREVMCSRITAADSPRTRCLSGLMPANFNLRPFLSFISDKLAERRSASQSRKRCWLPPMRRSRSDSRHVREGSSAPFRPRLVRRPLPLGPSAARPSRTSPPLRPPAASPCFPAGQPFAIVCCGASGEAPKCH
jgi:hypothetical protein